MHFLTFVEHFFNVKNLKELIPQRSLTNLIISSYIHLPKSTRNNKEIVVLTKAFQFSKYQSLNWKFVL